jgi:hypothetical protein
MATLALAGVAKVALLDQIFYGCCKWLFQAVSAPVIIGLRLIAVWGFHRRSFSKAIGVAARNSGRTRSMARRMSGIPFCNRAIQNVR